MNKYHTDSLKGCKGVLGLHVSATSVRPVQTFMYQFKTCTQRCTQRRVLSMHVRPAQRMSLQHPSELSAHQHHGISIGVNVTTYTDPCLFHSAFMSLLGLAPTYQNCTAPIQGVPTRRPDVLRYGTSGWCSLCTSEATAAHGNMACNTDQANVNPKM